jgi:hypothetical protein
MKLQTSKIFIFLKPMLTQALMIEIKRKEAIKCICHFFYVSLEV